MVVYIVVLMKHGHTNIKSSTRPSHNKLSTDAIISKCTLAFSDTVVQSSFGRDKLGRDSGSFVQQPNELKCSVDNTTRVEVTTHHLTHLGGYRPSYT